MRAASYQYANPNAPLTAVAEHFGRTDVSRRFVLDLSAAEFDTLGRILADGGDAATHFGLRVVTGTYAVTVEEFLTSDETELPYRTEVSAAGVRALDNILGDSAESFPAEQFDADATLEVLAAAGDE